MLGTITFNGQIGMGSILTLLTAIVGFMHLRLQLKENRSHVERVETKVDEVNKAVNSVGPGGQPLVQNVQDLHDQVMAHAPDRRSGDTSESPLRVVKDD